MRAVCPRGAEFGGRWPPRGARAAGAGGGARAVELQRDERLHRLLLLLHILVLRRQGAGRGVSGLALNAAVCATRPDARRCKGCRATACTSSSSRISSSLGGVASLPCSSSVQLRSIADMAQAAPRPRRGRPGRSCATVARGSQAGLRRTLGGQSRRRGHAGSPAAAVCRQRQNTPRRWTEAKPSPVTNRDAWVRRQAAICGGACAARTNAAEAVARARESCRSACGRKKKVVTFAQKVKNKCVFFSVFKLACTSPPSRAERAAHTVTVVPVLAALWHSVCRTRQRELSGERRCAG